MRNENESKTYCSLCDKEIHIFETYYYLNDLVVCRKCINKYILYLLAGNNVWMW